MTPERLREIARDCGDVSVVSSESNASELRAFADELERGVNHSCWAWNRRIIEGIRAVIPGNPVLDEDLVNAVRERFYLCSDCPPKEYPTDKTRCAECARRDAVVRDCLTCEDCGASLPCMSSEHRDGCYLHMTGRTSHDEEQDAA